MNGAPKQPLDKARSRGVGAWTQPQSLCGEEGARVHGWCSRCGAQAKDPADHTGVRPAPRSGNAAACSSPHGPLCVFKSLPSTRVTGASAGKVIKRITASRVFHVCVYVYVILFPSEERDKASLAS